MRKICHNMAFLWPLFSCIRTKFTIPSIYKKITVREKTYYGILYCGQIPYSWEQWYSYYLLLEYHFRMILWTTSEYPWKLCETSAKFAEINNQNSLANKFIALLRDIRMTEMKFKKQNGINKVELLRDLTSVRINLWRFWKTIQVQKT